MKGYIPGNTLSKILGISNCSTCYYLNDKRKINSKLKNKLLEYYSCKTIEELQNKFEIKTIKSDMIEKNNVSINNFYNDDKLLNYINPKILLSIAQTELIKDDLIIVYLLFGGYKNRYYSVESISKFLKIEEEYIIYIKRKCLEMYKSVYENIKDYNEELTKKIAEDNKKTIVCKKTE